MKDASSNLAKKRAAIQIGGWTAAAHLRSLEKGAARSVHAEPFAFTDPGDRFNEQASQIGKRKGVAERPLVGLPNSGSLN